MSQKNGSLSVTKKGIKFQLETSVKSYDNTTLFCPSGMQQFKSKFKDINCKETISNIQPCIRLNDLDEIGDGTHLLYFNMIGLFSFRQLEISETIDLWMDFLQKIGIKPDYVTIHPDKEEWKNFYKKYNIEVKYDKEGCLWSDGEIGGYSTEFYKNEIEIGNIVNPLGDCIDVGFGLERIELVLNGKNRTKEETLKESVIKIIESGIKPSGKGSGFVLRKLLGILYKNEIEIDHIFYKEEKIRQERLISRYNKLKIKYQDKSKEWWKDTHGIDLDEKLNNY